MNTLTKPDPRLNVPKRLVKLNNLANRISVQILGTRDNCILVSTMLNQLLTDLGYNSRLVRITAAMFPDNRNQHGTVLGSEGDGTRCQKAEKGMWHGHLGVMVDEKWLLDPTLDQIDGLKPVVIRLSQNGGTYYRVNKSTVRHTIYPKQVGFKWAGDARPCRWKDIYNSILEELK